MNDAFSKNNCSHAFFQIYYVFTEQELQQGDIIVTNYDRNVWTVSGMYILNEVCNWTASIAVIHFFYGSVTVSWEHLKLSICQGHCVYFATLIATIHIITSGLWLIRENLNDLFI